MNPFKNWNLLAMLAGIANFLATFRFGARDEEKLESYKTEGDDYNLYTLPYDKTALAASFGDVETVTDMGWDPITHEMIVVVAKEGVDTASIKADFGDRELLNIATIRPTTMGVAAVSGEVDVLRKETKFHQAIQGLIASGFVPAEGANFRHNLKPQEIRTLAIDTSANYADEDTKDTAVELSFGKLAVRFLAFAYGRMVILTDGGAQITKRISAAMFLEIIRSNGKISDAYAKNGATVSFDSAPMSILGYGNRMIVGLNDGKTNVAIEITPGGRVTTSKDAGDYGALVSLYADVAEHQTETAITIKDGQLGRVPLAALPAQFRRTAGIALGTSGNGNGASRN
ncbi:hypothetical protein HYV72_00135 [Candidatus Uhrbacteria bacterium]|nr:hypothetical protein [Candidatus Uhrbacteria bacterium]